MIALDQLDDPDVTRPLVASLMASVLSPGRRVAALVRAAAVRVLLLIRARGDL